MDRLPPPRRGKQEIEKIFNLQCSVRFYRDKRIIKSNDR